MDLSGLSMNQRLQDMDVSRLTGIRRGIEKEGLRVRPDGSLSMAPHPLALGSALTHPYVTTDFSESQLELVTGVHASAQACIDELTAIHRFVLEAVGDELMWAPSMPGHLPADADIPIGQYGCSNVGMAKRVYRQGLSHRYGSRMQTISGIHYNWSFPGASSEDYFGLIRNFRRHSFLLLMLFGASPAVTAGFVADQDHALHRLNDDTFYLPHATSLRMGRLGYQSDAQSALRVSYNDLEGYADSLHNALTDSYGPYEQIGVADGEGGYRQLSTSLLQIENEFYSTIRPKRVIRTGERPLHALRERGVEYVEVRCMDLNPFLAVGIDAHTARVLDVFLLQAMLSDSPSDTTEEIEALMRNHHLVAARGREPGLMLERNGVLISVQDWGNELLESGWAAARALDGAQGGTLHQQSWQQACEVFADFARLPSARVLSAMHTQHSGRHDQFGLTQSAWAKSVVLQEDMTDEQAQKWRALASDSVADQARMEADDKLSFEAFRQAYVSSEGLLVKETVAAV